MGFNQAGKLLDFSIWRLKSTSKSVTLSDWVR